MNRWYVVALLATTTIAISWPGSAGVVFRESLQFAVSVSLCSLPFGCLLGIVGARLSTPFNPAIRLATFILLAIPAVLHAAAWEACLGLHGWLTPYFPEGIAPFTGWAGAFFVHCCLAIPWISLLVGWQLRVASRELDDDLQLAIDPFYRTFYGVYPAIGQIAGIAFLWVVLQVLGEMAVTDIFRVRTYAEELYLGYAADGFGFGPTRLAANGPTALIIPFLGWLVSLTIVMEIRQSPPELSNAQRILARSDLRLFWMSLGAFLCVALLLFIPTASLVYHAGLVLRTTPESDPTWSVLKMLNLVANAPSEFAHEYFWTTIIAGTSTTLGTLVVVVSLAIAQRNKLARLAVWGIGTALLAVPSTTMGIMLSSIFSLPLGDLGGYLYDQTILVPVLASLAKQIPLQLMLLSLAYASIPKEQFDLAKMQGLSVGSFLRTILLPQITPCLAATWLAGFIISAGDLAASILVMPPGTTTLTVRIFGLLHAGIEDRLAALCLSTALFFAVMAWLLEYFQKKWQDRR